MHVFVPLGSPGLPSFSKNKNSQAKACKCACSMPKPGPSCPHGTCLDSLANAVCAFVRRYGPRQGYRSFRTALARFLEPRYGHPVSPDHLVITAGASGGTTVGGGGGGL